MTPREPWTAARLKHSAEQRMKIMACIQRLNNREAKAIDRAVMRTVSRDGTIQYTLPRPHLREQIRAWYRERWEYLVREYEAILPHVTELPSDYVEGVVKAAPMEADSECEDLPRR